ncbi:MAG: NERD domain-containing protein [Lachnospiraceae bacterium]|nr:NERD domain-containing protein [Lachnospiraceae bacterium]
MVTFIPPYIGEEIKSSAEKKMFDILGNLDMKHAYVLHSLGLPKHHTKIYGEIDFVVVCDRGIACLEIKGGRVDCRGGIWYFTDRYGVEREKSEGPFAQVTGNMFSLRTSLKNRFPDNRHMKNVLMACGVVFPDISFTASSEEIIPEIVYDRRTPDITGYIQQIFDYWENRQHKETSKLSPSDMEMIVSYLRGEFTFIPRLGDRLESVERRLIRLTAEQAQLMEALSLNEHLLIEGSAGTGKTLLAVDFAVKRAQAGDRVLFLTYNKNLSNDIHRQTQETANLKVINIHALFGEYVEVDAKTLQENPQNYFSEILPEAFYEYIKNISETERSSLQYDLIVMDEGQDIIRPVYLHSLDYLLKNGLENGRWAVFYDGKQNIYNPEYPDGMELLLSLPCTKFRLFVNCRNTVQIGTYTSEVSGIAAGDYIREIGEEVQKIIYTGEADFRKQIKKILNVFRTENVAMQDVTFLSPKRYVNSRLSAAAISVADISGGEDAGPELPHFATIQGFKGLDSKIVILVDVEDIREEQYAQFMYIAATRARTLLYVVEKGK